MEEDKRLYPISGEVFNQRVLPVIEGDCIWKWRPPKAPHCQAFCGTLVCSDGRPPVAGFACGIRLLACDI
jgi:hypothetical protein